MSPPAAEGCGSCSPRHVPGMPAASGTCKAWPAQACLSHRKAGKKGKQHFGEQLEIKGGEERGQGYFPAPKGFVQITEKRAKSDLERVYKEKSAGRGPGRTTKPQLERQWRITLQAHGGWMCPGSSARAGGKSGSPHGVWGPFSLWGAGLGAKLWQGRVSGFAFSVRSSALL